MEIGENVQTSTMKPEVMITETTGKETELSVRSKTYEIQHKVIKA